MNVDSNAFCYTAAARHKKSYLDWLCQSLFLPFPIRKAGAFRDLELLPRSSLFSRHVCWRAEVNNFFAFRKTQTYGLGGEEGYVSKQNSEAEKKSLRKLCHLNVCCLARARNCHSVAVRTKAALSPPTRSLWADEKKILQRFLMEFFSFGISCHNNSEWSHSGDIHGMIVLMHLLTFTSAEIIKGRGGESERMAMK